MQRRLLSRIAVAGIAIIALLGGLAVIDALYVPPPTALPANKIATLEPPAKEIAQAETPKSEANVPDTESTVVSDGQKNNQAGEPELSEQPTPIDAPTSSSALKPATTPAQAIPVNIKPHLAPLISKSPSASHPAPPIGIAPQAGEGTRHAPPARPLTQGNDGRQYLVQMGVFNNVTNAEELRAKLELNGIPATIEARVRVGPFASKDEAEAAQAKMAALGITPGMLVATKK
ncbi:MAG TPA: SPOR domain-containing protein [Rhodocyclaceae bacterium]|nr:SPOR domain-containing protein [Rhodocyclaceae bacterium]